MINDYIQSLERYLRLFPEILKSISIEDLEHKVAPDKWSKKEILGHLIDSAINNLSRFINAQYQNNPIILYNQVEWCKGNFYQIADYNHLITLWESLNRQLVFIWSQYTPQVLSKTANDHNLEFLIKDYLLHFEHHLNQINRENR